MKKIKIPTKGNKPNITVIAVPSNTVTENKQAAIPTPAITFDGQYMYNIYGDMVKMPKSTTDVVSSMVETNNLIIDSCNKTNDEFCSKENYMFNQVRFNCHKSSYKIIVGQFTASVHNIQSCLYKFVEQSIGVKIVSTESILDMIPTILSFPIDNENNATDMLIQWAFSHINMIGSKMYNDINMAISEVAVTIHKKDYDSFIHTIDTINNNFRYAMGNLTYEASVFAHNLERYIANINDTESNIDNTID